MSNLFTADVYTVAELAKSSGARRSQIEGWCRNGIIVPYKDSNGFGSRRLFKGAIPILDATEAGELTKAAYSNRQILRRFAVQRASLAALPPDVQVVERFRMYIATITMLADTFGRGPGYTEWLATQQAQLKRMEKALGRADADTRVLNLLAASANDSKALAG
jgi:hypothetical protein